MCKLTWVTHNPSSPPRGSEAQPVAARAAARTPRRCGQAHRWPLSPSVPHATGEAAPARLGPPLRPPVSARGREPHRVRGGQTASLHAESAAQPLRRRRRVCLAPTQAEPTHRAGSGPSHAFHPAGCPRPRKSPELRQCLRWTRPGPARELGRLGVRVPEQGKAKAPAECHGGEAPHAAADSVKGHKGRGGAGGGSWPAPPADSPVPHTCGHAQGLWEREGHVPHFILAPA